VIPPPSPLKVKGKSKHGLLSSVCISFTHCMSYYSTDDCIL